MTAYLVRVAAFSLFSAALLAGCGGGKDPADVVRAWSRAVNAGDNDGAARLFAPGAHAEYGDLRFDVGTYVAAVGFNEQLPCSGTIVAIETRENVVTATFLLARRERVPPWLDCQGAGDRSTAQFVVEEGKIAVWRQLVGAQAAG